MFLFILNMIFFSSVLKLLFNLKNLMVSLISLEVMGLSIFMFMLNMNSFMYFESFFFFFMCFMVSGSCLGLVLLIVFSLSSKKELENSMKNILC